MYIEFGELKRAYSEMIFGWQELPVRDWHQDEAEKNAGILCLIQEWEEYGKWGGKRENGTGNERRRKEAAEGEGERAYEERCAETYGRKEKEERERYEEKGKKDRFYGSRSFLPAGHVSVEGRGRSLSGAGTESGTGAGRSAGIGT